MTWTDHRNGCWIHYNVASISITAMAQAMMMTKFPYKLASISQSHRDVTEERYRDLRRPRKVKFYCNGDRYFKGKRLNITPHRYLTFNDLLFDLTGKISTGVQSVHLPYGVRQIFTPVGGRKVRDLEDLQDGQAYVCGGFEPFRPIKYGAEALEPWSIGEYCSVSNKTCIWPTSFFHKTKCW